jgi:DNA-directed RNA polymerase subunit RPC12/RpoP
MTIESLNCPNCGATLEIKVEQTLVVCEYCNSNIRFSPQPGGSKERQAVAEINWSVYADLPDMRRFVTDGSFLINLKYVHPESLPGRSVPAQALLALLKQETNVEFSLDELVPSPPLGHYLAPHNILLNKRYVESLRQTRPEFGNFRLRGRGELDAVIIYDGEAIIGAIVPMKH